MAVIVSLVISANHQYLCLAKDIFNRDMVQQCVTLPRRQYYWILKWLPQFILSLFIQNSPCQHLKSTWQGEEPERRNSFSVPIRRLIPPQYSCLQFPLKFPTPPTKVPSSATHLEELHQQQGRRGREANLIFFTKIQSGIIFSDKI